MASTTTPSLKQLRETPTMSYRKVDTLGLFKHQAPYPLLRALAFSPDGKLLGGAFDRYVTIWKVETTPEANSLIDLQEKWTAKVILSLDDSADEELCFFSWTEMDVLLIGSSSGAVKIGQFAVSRATFKGFEASFYPIRFLALHRSCALLAVGAGDNEVKIWRLEQDAWRYVDSLHLPERWTKLSTNVLKVTFIGWKEGGDDNVLIVAFLHHGVFSWHVDSMQCTVSLSLDKVRAATLSPDGRHIAMPGEWGTYQIFDLEAKVKVSNLTEPAYEREKEKRTRTVSCPGYFLHEGQYFLGVSSSGRINVWNVSRSFRAQRLDLSPQFSEAPVALLAVSSTRFASSGEDIRIAACCAGKGQQIEVWKSRVGVMIPEVQAPTVDVVHVSFSKQTTVVGILGAFVGGMVIFVAMRWM